MFTICILNVNRKRTFSLRVSKYIFVYIPKCVCIYETTSRWSIYIYVNWNCCILSIDLLNGFHKSLSLSNDTASGQEGSTYAYIHTSDTLLTGRMCPSVHSTKFGGKGGRSDRSSSSLHHIYYLLSYCILLISHTHVRTQWNWEV
jgi:hypothetical protein